MEAEELYVKENVVRKPVLSLGGLGAAVALAALLLGGAALVDVALPEPRPATDPPHLFLAEIAHQHLVNLTSIGPRVAGSYENEVLGVLVVVEAVKRIAARAAPHLRLELDLQTASGAFPLAFMDGMNHVYHDVQNVVVRLRAAGTAPPRPRALLLNCHIDTVPDSPGASDDGAGCAVLLETLRALSSARSPPRHDAIFLFNGAEENVLQASHAFITQHKWARSVRAFINIEACGAGGREVLFQAGPHDPWILEVYAGAVPHPFASSLAQELFESGLIPADTDFRIFRDFGNLSGVDLAWSANGYVYHTALDTAERVSRAVLQRTGDNVLALAHGLLSSAELESEAERGARQPVYFDVVGALVVSARAPAALLAALAALALLAADVQLVATRARAELFVSRAWWWREVLAGALRCAGAGAGGAGAALAAAATLHALHARLSFYARPELLAPLYALPALSGSWSAARALSGRRARLRGAGGWWAARALQQGGAACAALALLGCLLARLRSGFLPALWVAFPSGAGCLHSTLGGRSSPAWWWAGGAALPALQTWYLALGSWRMFVPIAGRAGDMPLPPDVVIAALTAALVLAACSWLLPLVVAARTPRALLACMWCACVCACAAVWCGGGGAGAGGGGAYSPERPQRLMVFHTRRTLHLPRADPVSEHFYWVPQLDVNTPHSVDMYAEEMRLARRVTQAECARWLYCGMPYYLPVLGLVRASHVAPAPAPPRPRLRHALRVAPLNRTHAALTVRLGGAAHMVLVVSPGAGARLAWSSAAAAEPLPGPRWGARRVYFYAVHCARPRNVTLTLHIQRDREPERGRGDTPRALRAGEEDQDQQQEAEEVVSGTQVSLAAHALFGAESRTEEHARLLRRMPRWVAPTGWGVDLHLHQL